MSEAIDLDSTLSRSKIVLWVEDRLTKEYLLEIWGTEAQFFTLLVGGGNQTIQSVVHDLRVQGHAHVFGLIDRDFRQSNRDRWQNADAEFEVYKPERLEMENYLLDWDALAGCRGNHVGRSVQDIETRATTQAGQMTWWMACRSVLADYSSRFIGSFPKHPKIPNMQSRQDARDYICSCPWFADLPENANHIQDRHAVGADLSNAHSIHQSELDDGSWCGSFSGREIFRNLRGYVSNRSGAAEELDVDLAKDVAAWQVEHGRVPDEIVELKASLKRRVGI